MSFLPFAERCQTHREVMASFLKRLEEKPVVIHVPKQTGLRRPHPKMFFHLAPELFFQLGGSTEFVCPADHFHLRTEEIALIPRGVPHGETARDHRGSPFRGLVFGFHGNEVTLYSTISSPEGKPAGAFCDTFEGPEVLQAVRYLDDAVASQGPAMTGRRKLLIFLAISVLRDLLAPERLNGRILSHEHPKVRHCHELIRARLPDPALSVESLARQLSCTPDHLSRCFRAETGMSVLAYVRQQRLARAKDLLQDPKLNVSEIAWACGFSSLNYFVRVFRQAMGQPPRQFQRAVAPAKPGAGR